MKPPCLSILLLSLFVFPTRFLFLALSLQHRWIANFPSLMSFRRENKLSPYTLVFSSSSSTSPISHLSCACSSAHLLSHPFPFFLLSLPFSPLQFLVLNREKEKRRERGGLQLFLFCTPDFHHTRFVHSSKYRLPLWRSIDSHVDNVDDRDELLKSTLEAIYLYKTIALSDGILY